MATRELLLRTLLEGHPNLDLVCQISRDDIEGQQRERAGLVDAMQREREALQQVIEKSSQTVSALQQALSMARTGTAGVVSGERVAGFMVTQAEAEALAQKRVLEYKRVASYDPFPRILPHSPSTPSERSTASGSGGGAPISASPTSKERKALKEAVAKFYGLSCDDDPNSLVDMLGLRNPFHKVELAHIWPASYQDFGYFARDMALPGDFFINPRNYLLLPRDLHEAFDGAKVCFIPCQAGIRVRVLHGEGISGRVAALDGTLLHLPNSAATPPGVPYKSILGWMAWLAKGFRILTPESEEEMREALGASGSSEGNAALTSLVGNQTLQLLEPQLAACL